MNAMINQMNNVSGISTENRNHLISSPRCMNIATI